MIAVAILSWLGTRICVRALVEQLFGIFLLSPVPTRGPRLDDIASTRGGS